MSKQKATFPDVSPNAVVADAFGGAESDFVKDHAVVESYDWGPSMTRQEFADDCDINSIMSRYEATGIMNTPFAKEGLHYADYSNVPDLMTAMSVLSDAQDAFMTLPASVRRQFDNDPVEFVAFASDSANLDQMRLWGLAPPKPVEPPLGGSTVFSAENPLPGPEAAVGASEAP